MPLIIGALPKKPSKTAEFTNPPLDVVPVAEKIKAFKKRDGKVVLQSFEGRLLNVV